MAGEPGGNRSRQRSAVWHTITAKPQIVFTQTRYSSMCKEQGKLSPVQAKPIRGTKSSHQTFTGKQNKHFSQCQTIYLLGFF